MTPSSDTNAPVTTYLISVLLFGRAARWPYAAGGRTSCRLGAHSCGQESNPGCTNTSGAKLRGLPAWPADRRSRRSPAAARRWPAGAGARPRPCSGIRATRIRGALLFERLERRGGSWKGNKSRVAASGWLQKPSQRSMDASPKT
jgi:hypothetical protein